MSPYVVCDNETCPSYGKHMMHDQVDSRHEWFKAYYYCEECGQAKVHYRCWDQLGLVTSDELYTEKEGENFELEPETS